MIGWLVALTLYCLGVVSAQADWDTQSDGYAGVRKVIGYCLVVILWPLFMVIFIFRHKEPRP